MDATAVPQLEGVLGLFLVLAWIFTGLRVYVRCLISKSWGADDSLLLAALVTLMPFFLKEVLTDEYTVFRWASQPPLAVLSRASHTAWGGTFPTSLQKTCPKG